MFRGLSPLMAELTEGRSDVLNLCSGNVFTTPFLLEAEMSHMMTFKMTANGFLFNCLLGMCRW